MTINIYRILSFVFILNILRLYPSFFPGSLGVFFGGRFIDIVIVSILATILLIRFSKFHFSDICLLLGIPIFVLVFLYGISLFSGISMGYEFSTFSAVEFFRYSLTGIIGLVFLRFGSLINNNFINKFWIYLILLNLIFNCCLLFVPGFQLFADLFISSKTKLSIISSSEASLSYVLRSSGLFINPNWAGLFYNLALTYFIFVPRDVIKMNVYLRFLLVMSTLICIFMTGSRTAVVLTLALLLIYFFIKLRLWSILIIFFLYFIVKYISFDIENFTFLPVHYRDLLNAIFIYGDLSIIGSFGDRLDLWKGIYENFILLNPSIGFGVTDSIGIADNQYLWMLASYGYIGCSVLFIYFLTLLSSMIFQNSFIPSNIFYMKYIYITFILFLIAGLSGQFFNVTQLIFLWFMMFGIYLSRIRGA